MFLEITLAGDIFLTFLSILFCPYEDNKMILEERSRFRVVM